MADLCLTFICPPTIEEKLLDTLLATPGADVFTSTHTHSHGTAPSRLSADEQVMGRQRSLQVQVLLTREVSDSLIAALKTEFKGAGLRYWATTLVFEGELA